MMHFGNGDKPNRNPRTYPVGLFFTKPGLNPEDPNSNKTSKNPTSWALSKNVLCNLH